MPKKKTKMIDLSAYVRVAAEVHDIDADHTYLEIAFLRTDGQWDSILVSRTLLVRPNEIRRELLGKAAALPVGGGDWQAVLGSAPLPRRQITTKTGWHGDAFVLPDITFGGDTLRFNETGVEKPTKELTKGSAADWKEGLKTPCKLSSYLTFAVAMPFAAPLVSLVGIPEGAVFHMNGQSSTGKTLAEITALSVSCAASRHNLATFDMTDRALEECAAAHNDQFMAMDEIARMGGSPKDQEQKLKEFAHKLTGGGGRRRSRKATQDRDLANTNWRILCLSSGEHPLDCADAKARDRGEQVRLIGIPVPDVAKGGIFDRTVDPAQGIADALEKHIAINFGHAFREYLTVLVKDREQYGKRARELIAKFVKKVGAEQDSWTRRFATKFAVVYAGAKIASEMGVAPWSLDHPYKCVSKLYRAAREIVMTPEESTTDLMHRLSAAADNTSKFPRFKKGLKVSRKRRKKMWGLNGRTREGVRYLAIPLERFDSLVRPRRHADAVRTGLRGSGAVIGGKEGRSVRQIKVRGYKSTKPYFLCIRRDRLPN